MNLKSIFFLVIVAVASSCHFYKEYDKNSFPTYAWNAGQEVTFYPTIDDIKTS
jgi:hypothetical protein